MILAFISPSDLRRDPFAASRKPYVGSGEKLSRGHAIFLRLDQVLSRQNRMGEDGVAQQRYSGQQRH